MVTPVSTSSHHIPAFETGTSDYGQGEIEEVSPTPILLSQWPNPQNSFVGRNKSFPPPEHKANIKFVPHNGTHSEIRRHFPNYNTTMNNMWLLSFNECHFELKQLQQQNVDDGCNKLYFNLISGVGQGYYVTLTYDVHQSMSIHCFHFYAVQKWRHDKKRQRSSKIEQMILLYDVVITSGRGQSEHGL